MLKKTLLFSLIMVFFYTTAAFGGIEGVGITFIFANGEITGAGSEYYEFDIMVNADEEGTKIGISVVYINYNTVGFGPSVVNGGNITVTEGTLISEPFPYALKITDNTSSKVSIGVIYTDIFDPESGADLPTTPIQLVHVKMKILDPKETAGLSFDEDLMIGNELQSDATLYDPVIAIDTDNSSLPVELSAFTATYGRDGCSLEWKTEAEINNIGFYVYRSPTKDGEYTRVNNKMIDGAGSSGMPNTYKYIDDSVETDVETYFYYLEDIDVFGIKTRSQIINATRNPNLSIFTAEINEALSTFTASISKYGDTVNLKWAVPPNVNSMDWNVYRSATQNGDYVKLEVPIKFDDATKKI
jgi:hypothetical protein